MKQFFLLLFLILGWRAMAQVYEPIPLSGFNHDVIAEGSGESTIENTTKEMDAVPISNFVMCTKEFAEANGFQPAGLYGLPNDGILSSGNKTFQIAPYDANNVAYLLTQESVVLPLTTPKAYSNVSLLGLSTENQSEITVTFRFADGSSQVSNQTLPDWFANPSSPFKGYGRVKRIDGPFEQGVDYEAAPAGNPAFTPLDFAVPCTKILQSIEVKNVSSIIPQSSSNRSFIFAISGFASTVPAVSVLASVAQVCSGEPVTFTATPTNGGTTPVYLWKINGQAAGSNSPTFTTSALAPNELVTCSLTSNVNCAAPPTVVSAPVSVVILPRQTPSISITTADTAFCSGTDVLFAISDTLFAGTQPNYQWRVNGQNLGENFKNFELENPDSATVVTCLLTSNSGCLTTDTALSNPIKVHVFPIIEPQIEAVAPVFANEGPVALSALPAGGGFSGAWVHGTLFYPDTAGAGMHTVYYQLTNNECATIDSILIEVRVPIVVEPPLPCALEPATLITPNTDQLNTTWNIGIFNKDCITKATVEVFNRWGKSVYQSDNYGNDWDGKTGGKELAEGPYFFTIRYTTAAAAGNFTKNGIVTIAR